MRLFPWIHATQEGLRFGYQLLYLLDSSPYYSPALHLLGQNIVRVSGQEMVSQAYFELWLQLMYDNFKVVKYLYVCDSV